LSRDLAAFSDFDRNGDAKGFYTVRTLYLDSVDWACFHEKGDGACERHKLRVRVYPGRTAQASSVKFEVKHRSGLRGRKDLADVPPAHYAALLPLLGLRGARGPAIGEEEATERRSHEATKGPASLGRILEGHTGLGDDPAWQPALPSSAVLRTFFLLKQRHAYRPVLCVQYRRQALRVRGDRRMRITMDDRLTHGRARDPLTAPAPISPVLGPLQFILEIKTPGRVPPWLQLMINKYRLRVQSVSKYALAAAAGPYGLESQIPEAGD